MEIKQLNKETLVVYEKAIKEYIGMCFDTCGYDKNKIDEKMSNLLSYIDNDNTYVIGAFDNKNIIGFAWSYILENALYKEMHIAYLATDENRRREGIASNLVNNIIDYSKKKGLKRIALNVSATNLEAVNFYEKMNFSNDTHHMKREI